MQQFVDHGVPETGAWNSEVRPALSRLLQHEGLASQEQVEQAIAEGTRTGERLGEVLLRWALVDELQLAGLLARQWELPLLHGEEVARDPAAHSILTAEDARSMGVVPLRWEDGVLRMVAAEPTDERLGEVRRRMPHEVAFGVVTPSTFTRLLAELEASAPATPPPATAADEDRAQGLDELIGLLDDETGRLEALRTKVEQFATIVAERDDTVRRLEHELDAGRTARVHDRLTIDRLQREVEERDRLLDLVSGKIGDAAAVLRGRSAV